jgi:hypothetical protein
MNQLKKECFQLPNLRTIRATYKGPTNSRGSRVEISEEARFSDDRTERKTFSYDYAIGNVQEQAYQILLGNGFNVVAKSGTRDYYTFLVDNWGDDFVKISDLKK